MIIDSHTHIGFGNLLNASVSDLLISMKRAHIDKACVYAGVLNNCSTQRLLKELESYPDILYPIGSFSPFTVTKYDIKNCELLLKQKKIHGIKFYPGYEYFYPSDKKIRPLLKLLVQYNKPAIFHSGDTYNVAGGAKLKYAHPLHIDELAVEMPDLKIVIAHLGYPWIVDAAEVCYKNKNVYTDTSGFVYGIFYKEDAVMYKELLDTFVDICSSWDKVLFGTDWPLPDQRSYVRVIRTLAGSHADDVMKKNIQKVYNIF